MQQPNNVAGMSVQDVLGDAFETYLTLEDAKLIRDTFKNNPRLMRTLQKVFIPTIQDPEMPPEQMAADFWLQGKDWSNVPAEEVKPMIVGRQEALQFILGGLMRIKSIANVKDESKLEEAHRRAKDSTK
jgi:hypothetical protein